MRASRGLLRAAGAAACDPVAREADGAVRGEELPLTLDVLPIRDDVPLDSLLPSGHPPSFARAVGDQVEVEHERESWTCNRRDERERYRASLRGDTLVVRLHRHLLGPGACTVGTGLGFRFRTRVGPLPAGSYTLLVVQQDDGAPDTTFRAPVALSPAPASP